MSIIEANQAVNVSGSRQLCRQQGRLPIGCRMSSCPTTDFSPS